MQWEEDGKFWEVNEGSNFTAQPTSETKKIKLLGIEEVSLKQCKPVHFCKQKGRNATHLVYDV